MRPTLVFVVAMAAGCVQAQAAVYTLVDVVQTPKLTALFPFPSVSLTIADAAVQRGSFSVTSAPYGVYSGNGADFISFDFGQFHIGADGSGIYYSLLIGLTFSTTGAVTSGSFLYSGFNPGFTLAGRSDVMTGNYYPFDSSCLNGPASDCNISARIVESSSASVPEPVSFALVASGLVALVACRRQAVASRSNGG